MVRPGLVAFCILAAAAGVAESHELPRFTGLYQGGKPLPMLASKVEITVRGPIIEAIVTQRFTNPNDAVTEAVYIFPLPTDAAVTAMSIHTGGRTIHAGVEKRDQAQRRYESAIAAGIGAALLDQERSDVFTQTVSAIPAHGSVEITLRYDTTASFRDGTWQLAVPLVVAPRYTPGTASGLPTIGSGRTPDTNRAPDASRVTPNSSPGAGGPTTIAIAFAGPVDQVTSPTHDLAEAAGEYSLTDAKSDHDAIVRWRAPVAASGWVEQDADTGYAAVVVQAPAAPTKLRSARCLLAIDRAATTRGDADAVERPLVHALLRALEPSSQIAVTGSSALGWSTPEQAGRGLDAAWSHAPGPFDLTRVLGKARPEGSPIVLVTDGLVADDAAAIAAARAVGVPIHVIGIGPAPARGLLAAIANASGGTVRFAVAGDDLAALANDVVADVTSPPVPLAVTWGTLVASDIVPATLPRLGAGQATLVIARVKRAQQANGRARGDLFAIEPVRPQHAVEGATTPIGGLARRWARNRLDELIFMRAAPSTITTHALRFGLVSPYTSMVAIGTEVVMSGGVKHSVSVPVSVPAGMHWQSVRHETAVEVITVTGNAPTINPSTTTQGTVLKQPPTPAPVQPAPPPPPPAKADAKDSGKHHERPQHRPTAVDNDQHDKKKATKGAKNSDDYGGDDDDKPAGKTEKKDESFEDDGDYRPKKKRKTKGKADTDGGAEATEPTTKATAAASPPADVDSTYESAAGGEVVLTEGTRGSHPLRLTLGFGGGLAVHAGANDGLVAIDGRADFGRRTLVGVEGQLWLLGGIHPQGRLLLGLARRGIGGYLELGAGAGLELGDGAGPAFSLRLRTRIPSLSHVGPYLRYDGALLYQDGARHGLNALTLGAELSF